MQYRVLRLIYLKSSYHTGYGKVSTGCAKVIVYRNRLKIKIEFVLRRSECIPPLRLTPIGDDSGIFP